MRLRSSSGSWDPYARHECSVVECCRACLVGSMRSHEGAAPLRALLHSRMLLSSRAAHAGVGGVAGPPFPSRSACRAPETRGSWVPLRLRIAVCYFLGHYRLSSQDPPLESGRGVDGVLGQLQGLDHLVACALAQAGLVRPAIWRWPRPRRRGDDLFQQAIPPPASASPRGRVFGRSRSSRRGNQPTDQPHL